MRTSETIITAFTAVLASLALSAAACAAGGSGSADMGVSLPLYSVLPFSVTGPYTFVYQWLGNQWLIVEHHSSMMPEK